MKVIILTASYGAGHNSAARALAEEFTRNHAEVRVEDALALSPSLSYPLSCAFYKFCVNQAPWLWGLTYELTDKADWAKLVRYRLFAPVKQALEQLIVDWQPDLVICTYPLFSYMLDDIRRNMGLAFKHVAVVTDAIEVSRPWVRSQADCIMMTDEYSSARIAERYALGASHSLVSSFPTSARFYPNKKLNKPTEQSLRLLYSAQAPLQQCVDELRALVQCFPQMQITVLAGNRYAKLVDLLPAESCHIVERSNVMHDLMRSHHLYVGKPGGATMFECYASALPMVVNFALMGQEQGNLELLECDACGCYACGAEALTSAVAELLEHDAAAWTKMRHQMLTLPRRGGAERVRQICEDLLQS